ncbi:hypothetical protein J3458_002634 [Metarhizium acridum]|uniref:uncharacterized protein n=1 Tax=Metarhizium acridum TaxID=92637 RepID=UPI001C6D1975|nr:hypothetical protein J3458_002634 [Metarhizium acridum]
MSIRIALDNQPEFFTNLDHVTGRIILGLNRSEQVGSIVVKLEGESVTALQVPNPYEETGPRPTGPLPGPPGSIVSENHKILYKVQQVFPDEYHSSSSNPYGAFPLQPGEHEFPFKFKLPINNACSDPMAMSKIGGLAGVGGFGSGGGLFGMGGVRVMDGTKQLHLQHVTRTLPPSLTGYPMEAESRSNGPDFSRRTGDTKSDTSFSLSSLPGQHQLARKRLPVVRLPFGHDRPVRKAKKKNSFFAKKGDKSSNDISNNNGSGVDSPNTAPAPSIEMSARLPHPSILTCNQPIPLRLIAKKLANCPEQVNLISFQMDLIGITEVRTYNIYNKKINRWVVVSSTDLHVPLTSGPDAEVGSEVVVPDTLWKDRPLPNTVAPSFVTCNLSRRYEVEIKLGLCWGKAKSNFINNAPQTIFLPLHFAAAEVFSGITPPPELVRAARNTRPGRATLNIPPRLPPRPGSSAPSSPVGPPHTQNQMPNPNQPQAPRPQMPQRPPQDPLYPPQLLPGQTVPPYDDAPPSYDEAIAENLSGPFDGMQPRPAYSGVTNENAPSQMPAEKR